MQGLGPPRKLRGGASQGSQLAVRTSLNAKQRRKKLRIVTLVVSGRSLTRPLRDARLGAWGLSIVQGPFAVAPRQLSHRGVLPRLPLLGEREGSGTSESAKAIHTAVHCEKHPMNPAWGKL